MIILPETIPGREHPSLAPILGCKIMTLAFSETRLRVAKFRSGDRFAI
jgi:hypothetical protein